MQLFSAKKYYGKHICIAVSGGADSVCLLHAFSRIATENKITLSAVTCEHGIRGENSLRDMQFVQRLCDKWRIPLSCFRADIPARASANGRGLEEEGRIFRYECFYQILADGKADFVATAHHRDDLIETVLFRLARGTSLGGLAAITEHDRIIRPLLDVTRAEIERYVHENHLPYVTDESNSDENFTRNALRLNVLPELEKAVSGAGEHLLEFARRAKSDDEFLTELAESRLKRLDGEVAFSAELPVPLFTRACVLAMKTFGITSDYTAENINEVLKLKNSQSGKRICLQNGLEAFREGTDIVFLRSKQPFQGELPFALGEFIIGAYHVVAATQERPDALRADRSAFPADCVIRTRREGDLFTPFGGQKKSLKKYLTDKKIPARIGKNLPLVAKDGEVYAIFGVEIAESVKVTKATEEIIYLTAESPR